MGAVDPLPVGQRTPSCMSHVSRIVWVFCGSTVMFCCTRHAHNNREFRGFCQPSEEQTCPRRLRIPWQGHFVGWNSCGRGRSAFRFTLALVYVISFATIYLICPRMRECRRVHTFTRLCERGHRVLNQSVFKLCYHTRLSLVSGLTMALSWRTRCQPLKI